MLSLRVVVVAEPDPGPGLRTPFHGTGVVAVSGHKGPVFHPDIHEKALIPLHQNAAIKLWKIHRTVYYTTRHISHRDTYNHPILL
ncbi:hypothetical protein DSLASN_39430 [Desulfoluna limicola]|uniref:Uncharacterized protein n=1 Tax=Desulfoluna limicola TaxID=2810562 RepID=A0ABM7PM49_9BACT|nr:hypothetical protein DSLASN_39430 [Desulfoluna limicola]